jgi:hypothetical protein
MGRRPGVTAIPLGSEDLVVVAAPEQAPPEEQAADHPDGVHGVHDGDHQVGEVVALLVEDIERRRHRREAHADQERGGRDPEADVVARRAELCGVRAPSPARDRSRTAVGAMVAEATWSPLGLVGAVR